MVERRLCKSKVAGSSPAASSKFENEVRCLAKNNMTQLDAIRRYNRIIEKQVGKAVRPYRADGFVNLINRYGTSKDINEHYHYMPEPEVPDELITQFYEGNGLFSKIIDAPAEEAVKHGFELLDLNDSKLQDFYEEGLDELDWEETAITSLKWMRLFGGSIAVMLINDGRGLEEPLDWRNIKSIDDICVYDRSVITPDFASMYKYDPQDPFRTRGSRLGMPETFQINSRYGSFVVHESRCLTFHNGVLPENATNSNYQMWGMPEYIRIRRAIRDAEVAHSSAPKLLERSVQPVYKMKDLSLELSTEEGEDKALRRLQTIDMARGMMNSMVIDADGEDYDFRTFQFTGVNDVVASSCNMLSAITNIPQVILFGSGVGGLSTTDDTSMENWYSFVGRIQKRNLRSNLRYLLSILFRAGVSTGEVDEVPNINIEFKPLWSMSDSEQADLEQKKAATQQTKAQTAQIYVDMQAIDPTEVRQKLADSEEFDVENMLDEYDNEDLFPENPEEMEPGGPHAPVPGQPQEGAPQPGAPEGGAPMPGAAQPEPPQFETKPEVEPHNTDPGTEGSASTAAPAATKLPQDMSEEEQQQAEKAKDEPDKEDEEEQPAGVGVIVVKDGKILSGVRTSGHCTGLICGPGGHIEEGETPEQAAIRETQEEFGITPTNLIPLGNGPKEPDTGITPAVFLCTDWEGEIACDHEEMRAPTFLSMEQIENSKHSLFQPFADGVEILAGAIEDIDIQDVAEEPEEKREIPRDIVEKPDDGPIPISRKEPFGNAESALDLLRQFILSKKNNGDPEEKTLDLSTEKDTIKSEETTGEDGAPLHNKNAAGPHNVKKKGVHKFKTVGNRMKITYDVEVKASKSGKVTFLIKADSDIEEIKTFAGKGSKNPLVMAGSLAKQYGGKPKDWSHKTGFAQVVGQNGKTSKREIHWFENDDVGQVGFKIKFR